MPTTTSPPPRHPVLGVSTLVRRGGHILLVRRGRPPNQGKWAFPGGRVEYGERLRDAAAREVMEETGVEAEIGAQIAQAEIIYEAPGGTIDGHFLLIVFAGLYRGGAVTAGDDAADARWVLPEAAEDLPLTPEARRVLGEQGLLNRTKQGSPAS